MAGNFSFTFKLPGDAGAAFGSTAAMRNPVVGEASAVPVLAPYELFSTRIWQMRSALSGEQIKAGVAEALALRAASPKPAGRTNRQGWNSEDMTVLERPAFVALRQAVHTACVAALREMGQHDVVFHLQSWINLHDRGGFNFAHVHEGSLLSGSFYLQVPPGSGKFVFRDPRPGVVHGYVKGAVANGYSDIHLTPETGLLVLFPCWMEHYVEPHNGDEPRIAIAFNANRGEA